MRVDEVITGFTAYHASPHKFDLFDNSFIDTGERKQMFGHGLYFTETLVVAKHYQKSIRRKPPTIYYDGKAVSFAALGRMIGLDIHKRGKDPSYEWRCLNRLITDSEQQDTPIMDVARYEATRHGGSIAAIFLDLGQKIANHVTRGGPTSFIYEAQINVSIDHLLQHDLPCEQQSEYVRARLVRHCRPDETGWNFYMRLSNRLGGDDKASVALVKLGIPGARYLDQVSREIGKGSYNYVIFDPRVIQIKRRFKLAS